MYTEEAIRLELQRILKEEPDNYNLILELSTKLSEFDKENIRFSTDAGIIDRLGSELVARQVDNSEHPHPVISLKYPVIGIHFFS